MQKFNKSQEKSVQSFNNIPQLEQIRETFKVESPQASRTRSEGFFQNPFERMTIG